MGEGAPEKEYPSPVFCHRPEMLTRSPCHLSGIVTVRICDLQACGEQDIPSSSPQSLPPPAGVYILVRDAPKLGLCLLGAPPPADRDDSTMGDKCHQEKDAQRVSAKPGGGQGFCSRKGHVKGCPEELCGVDSVES